MMIELAAQSNGAHRNQTAADAVPDGWAVIPESVPVPDTFPFVGVTAENGVVTALTAGTVPTEPADAETATQLDRIEAQVMYTALMTDTLIEEA